MAHELTVDAAKNRLYLKLSGLMSDEEATEAAEKTIAAFKKLRPRFTVITDISGFRPMSQNGVAQVKRCGVEGLKLGLLATCRIVGASAVAKLQFDRASHEAGYTSYDVGSLEDAERILDAVSAGQKPVL